MVKPLAIKEYLALSPAFGGPPPLLDVRTPAEFKRGHVPGSVNMPLFSDEERVIIGTLYKQTGRQAAIARGLEFVGPRMNELIAAATKAARENTVFVNCWRGGMRSASVAWLLDLYGLNVYTLKGGYKFFRRHVLNSLDEPRNFKILGGRTGSGKTVILGKLKALGEQVVDLEKLAHHKGSSFGSLGEDPDISQEQFENNLALELNSIYSLHPIWLEDESQMIGKKVLGKKLFEQMRSAPVAYVEIPFAERARYLALEYGKFSLEELMAAIQRISRRLGGMQAKQALEALGNNDLDTACGICLVYYDKSYDHGLNQREPDTIKRYKFETMDFEAIVKALMKK
jgi:tRNA 2-selenouridine synthase